MVKAEVTIELTCFRGHVTTRDEYALEMTNLSGCTCNETDDYCYCEEPRIEVRWECADCKAQIDKGEYAKWSGYTYKVELT